jgi:hypothetical protein
MLPSFEAPPRADERDTFYDAAAAQFAAPLARLAYALDDDPSKREAMLHISYAGRLRRARGRHSRRSRQEGETPPGAHRRGTITP